MDSVIRKVGYWTESDGRVLLCRKRGPMQSLILPGGKLETGESELQCLQRELQEELQTTAVNPQRLGEFRGPAAGSSAILELVVYTGELADAPVPSQEIAGLVWFSRQDDRALLSPSLRELVLPAIWG